MTSAFMFAVNWSPPTVRLWVIIVVVILGASVPILLVSFTAVASFGSVAAVTTADVVLVELLNLLSSLLKQIRELLIIISSFII